MTKPAVARAIGLSIIPMQSRQWAGRLSEALRASWLPKVTTGWFFRAESFFSVARYLDSVGSKSADFLSHSHGEGFLRFFEERCQRQGYFYLRRTGIGAVAGRDRWNF